MNVKPLFNQPVRLSGVELEGKFEFRAIRQEEAGQAAEIERICFPPNEACSGEMMFSRIRTAPEHFLVAVDRTSGQLAGFLNGLCTKEQLFRDEFFTDAALHQPEGGNLMLLGLDVLPAYRRQGLAGELVRRYVRMERANRKHALILTCLDDKVAMYEKMGFTDDGIANSAWGGEQWHQMHYVLDNEK